MEVAALSKLIDLQNITKAFDSNIVLDDMSLYIRENEFLTLLGPSGCGKTTTLRIIGGLKARTRAGLFLTAQTLPPGLPISGS